MWHRNANAHAGGVGAATERTATNYRKSTPKTRRRQSPLPQYARICNQERRS